MCTGSRRRCVCAHCEVFASTTHTCSLPHAVWCVPQSMFKLANDADPGLTQFRRHMHRFAGSLKLHPDEPRAWLNMALIHQCVTSK